MVYSREEGLAAVSAPWRTVRCVRHDATRPCGVFRPNESPRPRRFPRVTPRGVIVGTLGCPFKRTPSANRAAP
jgi:hypothetical protein